MKLKKKEFENDFDFNNSNEFEEIIEENYGDILIQYILKLVWGEYLFYAGNWLGIRPSVCIYTCRVFTFLKT